MEIQPAAKLHSPKTRMRKNKGALCRFAPIAILPLAVTIGQALANPDGGVVVGGQAAISQKPGITTVEQVSDRAVINWRGFSIAPGELTRFNQPGRDAVALNRVLGKDASKLLGQLKANGHVWLVNPNGILFGPSARVDVHGLIATTADIHDQDFLAGRNNFSRPSPDTDASVINQGTISIGEHGLAGLVAAHVRNAGVIQGQLGQVVIAGAPAFTLDFYGDGLIQFEATSQVTENEDPAQPLVRNDGRISVDGGDVLITANAAAGVVDQAINMDGMVEARSVGMESGAIVLKGGDEGIVAVAGRLDASGRLPGETGGTVKVLGEKVGLYAGTEIDVSGDAGGGEALIGGNYQGKGPEPNAKRTYVASEASMHADAVNEGDGGTIIVWADEVTGFRGKVNASGGEHRGDGGFVEISGKQNLSFEGTVDLSATNGQHGTLLLDPEDIDIVIEGDGLNDNELIDNQILLGDSPGAIFTISETVLSGLLEDADIILEAANNITITTTSSVDNTLSFQATTGSVTFTADADLDGLGTFTSQDVDIETQGGNVAIEAATVAGSSMEIRTNGGDISVESRAGEIPDGLSLFTDSSSDTAVGGRITVEAQGDIFLSNRPLNIDSSGPLGAGPVTITTSTGLVDIGNLSASSIASSGGAVNINAPGDILTGDIVSSGPTGGGNVTLTSTSGLITTNFATENDPPLNPIDASSTAGIGGTVDLTAATGIAIGAVNTSGPSGSGNISLESDVIDFTDLPDSVIGPGADLLIQPASPSRNIIIAGSSVTDLAITPAELTTFADGFNLITIGRSDGEGTISVDPAGVSFSDPLLLQSPGAGGSIQVNGPVQTTGGDVTMLTGGTLTLQAPVATSADQPLMLLVANGGFVNGIGANGLQPGSGRYLVYSPDPADDTRGIPNDQFNKRYGFAFDPGDPQGSDAGLPAEGNFFLYRIAPTLSIVADNASRKFGAPDPSFTSTTSGFIDGDTLDTALSEPLVLTTNAVVVSPPDDYFILVGPSGLSSPLGYAIETRPGVMTVTGKPIKDDPVFDPSPDVPIDKRVRPVVPQVLTERPLPPFSVLPVGSASQSSDLLSPNDGNRELWGPPR